MWKFTLSASVYFSEKRVLSFHYMVKAVHDLQKSKHFPWALRKTAKNGLYIFNLRLSSLETYWESYMLVYWGVVLKNTPVREWGKYAGQREMLKWEDVTEAAGNPPWSSATRMAFQSCVMSRWVSQSSETSHGPVIGCHWPRGEAAPFGWGQFLDLSLAHILRS